MDLYAIRRPSAWANLQELEAAGAKSARIGNDEMPDRGRWLRSYVVHEPDGRIGTICIYQARDQESIREHACRVGMPGSEPRPQRQQQPPSRLLAIRFSKVPRALWVADTIARLPLPRSGRSRLASGRCPTGCSNCPGGGG